MAAIETLAMAILQSPRTTALTACGDNHFVQVSPSRLGTNSKGDILVGARPLIIYEDALDIVNGQLHCGGIQSDDYQPGWDVQEMVLTLSDDIEDETMNHKNRRYALVYDLADIPDVMHLWGHHAPKWIAIFD